MISYNTFYKLLFMSSVATVACTMSYQSNKSVVYYTDSNLEIQSDDTNDFGVLKITALPLEFNDKEAVLSLCKDILKLGAITSDDVIVHQSKPRYNARLCKEIATNYAIISIHNALSTTACLQMKEALSCDNSVDIIVKDLLHWPNGDVMTHLSFKKIADKMEDIVEQNKNQKVMPTKSCEPLVLEEGEWTSLYVSNIPNMLGVECGDNTFMRVHPRDIEMIVDSNLMLGKVARVDYVKRETDTGVFVNDAFIHFQHWYDNDDAKNFRRQLNDGNSSVKVNGYNIGSTRRNLVVFQNNGIKKSAYLNFKINHKPIEDASETDMNIHQLVAANKFLNEELESKNAIIEKLEKELAVLKGDTSNSTD